MKKCRFITAIIAALLLSSMVFAAGAQDYYNYGNTTFQKGDYKKAMTYYSYAAKLDPKNPDYYRAIAACYGKLGNKAMAAKYNNYADSLGTGKNSPGRPAAEKIKITVFAGFTTVAMSKVNNDIDTLYSNAIAGGGTGQKEDLGSGFIIGAQGGYNVFPGLYAGPRMELIDVPTAKTTYSGSVFGMTYSGEADYSGSMFPVLVGASYYYPNSGPENNAFRRPLSGLWSGRCHFESDKYGIRHDAFSKSVIQRRRLCRRHRGKRRLQINGFHNRRAYNWIQAGKCFADDGK